MTQPSRASVFDLSGRTIAITGDGMQISTVTGHKLWRALMRMDRQVDTVFPVKPVGHNQLGKVDGF